MKYKMIPNTFTVSDAMSNSKDSNNVNKTKILKVFQVQNLRKISALAWRIFTKSQRPQLAD